MTVEELHLLLSRKPDATIEWQLPSGELIPDHYHVTEVGRVDKAFIDCGGTHRQATSCLLQVWTADDRDHRLFAGKLAGILKLAEPVLQSFQLPVEVEYGPDVASQYVVSDFDVGDNTLRFILTGRQTNCLAWDRCGIPGDGAKAGCC